MSANTKIEWAHHSWNPWWGCTKVSPACEFCYAAAFAKRTGWPNLWGPAGDRRTFGEAHWRLPLRWNQTAAHTGRRFRVFPSMCDPFDLHPALDAPRTRFLNLILQTPHLDWLLLTKRPEHILALTEAWAHWPPNAWVGATVEDQARALLRLPTLLEVPAPVRFLSCEPLLSFVTIDEPYFRDPTGRGIDWVITGGESGHAARPTKPSWFRHLRDQCTAAAIPFLFKQWGEWGPACNCPPIVDALGHHRTRHRYRDLDGEHLMFRCGRSRTGRLLDGAEHLAFPTPHQPRD